MPFGQEPCCHQRFNSRTREGCDYGVAGSFPLVTVSIHAPARGAITLYTAWIALCGFNSRTREGCDKPDSMEWGTCGFQFTHPRGVRCRIRFGPCRGRSFNSRTREGGDLS